MKRFKLSILSLLHLALCLFLSSCTTYRMSYDELESEYLHIKDEYEILEKQHEESLNEHYEEIENCYDIIDYYELICKEYGFLTHDQAYDRDYYYVEPGSLIYHTDFYCKKANSSKLQIVDAFLYTTLEECAECDAACNESYVIRLIDPVTKLYHHTYEACAPHFTKDYKTVSTPYIATTEQKAKEMKYTPCPICIKD